MKRARGALSENDAGDINELSEHSKPYCFFNIGEDRAPQTLTKKSCRSNYNYKNGSFVVVRAWTDDICKFVTQRV